LIVEGEASPFAELAGKMGYEARSKANPKIISRGENLRLEIGREISKEVQRILSGQSHTDIIVVDHTDAEGRDLLFSDKGIISVLDFRIRNFSSIDEAPNKRPMDFSSLVASSNILHLTTQDAAMIVEANFGEEIEISVAPVFAEHSVAWMASHHFFRDITGSAKPGTFFRRLYVEALREACKMVGISSEKVEELRQSKTKVDDGGIRVRMNDQTYEVEFMPVFGSQPNSIAPIQCVVHRNGAIIGHSYSPRGFVFSDEE